MMDYKLTEHAKKRMAERSISLKDLEVALQKPDIIQPALNRRKVFVKFIKGERLEVVTVEEKKKIIIITIYYAH